VLQFLPLSTSSFNDSTPIQQLSSCSKSFLKNYEASGIFMGKSILKNAFTSSCLCIFRDKASHSLSRVTTTISQLLTFWYPQWDSPRSKSWWRATGWWNGKSPLGLFHRQDYIDQNTAWSIHVTKQRQAPHRAWYPPVYLETTVETNSR
jgi:hypothetical protein